MTIEDTLAERGERYGSFEHHAAIAQKLQDVMRDQEGWENLQPDQKQALTTIADKIARMLNGKRDYRDNWHDIVGYAKLVDDRMLRDEERAKPHQTTVLVSSGQGGAGDPAVFGGGGSGPL
jgi:hypothetical protein